MTLMIFGQVSRVTCVNVANLPDQPPELHEYGHAPDDATVLELDGRLKMFIKLCGRYHSGWLLLCWLRSLSTPNSHVSHRCDSVKRRVINDDRIGFI